MNPGALELIKHAMLLSFQVGHQPAAQRALHLADALQAGVDLDEVQERVHAGEISGPLL